MNHRSAEIFIVIITIASGIGLASIGANGCGLEVCGDGGVCSLTGSLSNDGGVATGGSAAAHPIVSDLKYSPDTATVGQKTTVNGSVTFEAPNGNVTLLGLAITLPDGTSQDLPKIEVKDAAGLKKGWTSFVFYLVPPAAGTYDFEVWLVDADGNESNRLTGKVGAEP